MSNSLEYRVGEKAPSGLTIRSEMFKPTTKKAVLPIWQPVIKEAESATPGWWQVSTALDGTPISGFVNSAFLVPKSGSRRRKHYHEQELEYIAVNGVLGPDA